MFQFPKLYTFKNAAASLSPNATFDMTMINRAALICFDDINDDEDDVFHFKYIVMQANQTKGFRREFFSFAQIVHLLNILLLFTKYQSRSSFESNWMCSWEKLSMGTIPHQIYTSRLTLPIHIVQREDSCSTPHL